MFGGLKITPLRERPYSLLKLPCPVPCALSPFTPLSHFSYHSLVSADRNSSTLMLPLHCVFLKSCFSKNGFIKFWRTSTVHILKAEKKNSGVDIFKSLLLSHRRPQAIDLYQHTSRYLAWEACLLCLAVWVLLSESEVCHQGGPAGWGESMGESSPGVFFNFAIWSSKFEISVWIFRSFPNFCWYSALLGPACWCFLSHASSSSSTGFESLISCSRWVSNSAREDDAASLSALVLSVIWELIERLTQPAMSEQGNGSGCAATHDKMHTMAKKPRSIILMTDVDRLEIRIYEFVREIE